MRDSISLPIQHFIAAEAAPTRFFIIFLCFFLALPWLLSRFHATCSRNH